MGGEKNEEGRMNSKCNTHPYAQSRTTEFKLSSYCLRKRFLFHRFYDRTMQICPIATVKFHPRTHSTTDKMGNDFQLMSRTRMFDAVETLSREE